ncbi:uncharacterized protein LOC134240789 [Saccostrea cucullata]|uniref:uncharacterized protein LOC134240789 n=1 Tax=Saccostrea cuccullata TaxID=36930 RepID=UPI002ED677A1
MTAATVNSGELTVKGPSDWTSSVFEDEDRDFTNTCRRTRNEKSLGRLENVEDEETDQPVTLKDAPHLNKGEIENDLILQNIQEFNEPTIKRDRLPDNVTLPTDSGYYSQSEAASLDNSVTSIRSEEQSSSCTDSRENISHPSLLVQSTCTCKNEILNYVKETVEDIFKKTKELGSKMVGKRTKRKKKAKQSKKKRKTKTVHGRKIFQLLKPVASKAISRTQKYSLLNILKKEIRRYFQQKRKHRKYGRSKLLSSFVKAAGILDWNQISFKNLMTVHVYPVHWMCMQQVPEKMNIEWLRLCSFADVSFQKVSSLRLAKHGFYFNKDRGRIQCFTCDKSYTKQGLECTEDCNAKLKTSLHEDWCLIADGNIPIHPTPGSSLGISEDLPSQNKRPFKDETGRIITCQGLCGLNTFFVDQGNMLKEFPSLIDKYKNFNLGDGSINPFQVIFAMLRKGEKNSARGMREILLHTNLISPSVTTIKQFHFELINFVCELMKGKIIVKGKCACPVERVNKEEQIYISECKCHKNCGEFADGINFFQHWIDRRFDLRFIVCNGQVIWTLPEPPPCLFLKIYRLNFRMEHLPHVIHVLGNRYRLGSIYVHANQHFTAWVSRPQGMAFYDDRNEDQHDKFSAKLDDLKEFPGGGEPCLASYFVI